MQIASIEILELLIPFRFAYGHAKARHQGVQTILCIARDGEGREGYGEAVPRAYVTGESTDSVRRDIAGLVERLRADGFENLHAVFEECECAAPQAVPACAQCVLDLAMTDLLARRANRSVLDTLTDSPASCLTYTASIGMGSRTRVTAQLLFYKAMGLRHFKVKVGDPDDLARVRLIRQILGGEVSLFADANGAWDKDAAARRVEQLAANQVWAMEEPLRIAEPASSRSASGQRCRGEELTDRHLSDMAWLQARSPIPFIADESLISLPGAQNIVDAGAFKIFNIRLSKCGGYERSRRFAALARGAGLAFSLGAMVGESPVLAAAGTAWGASQPEHLYLQGHSHRLLHGVRFVQGCPTLRRGGSCVPNRMPGSGLKLHVAKLKPVVKMRDTYHV